MVRKLSLSIIILVFSVAKVMAQPGDPPDPDVPIDGGIGLLIAGGVALGIRMLQKPKGKQN